MPKKSTTTTAAAPVVASESKPVAEKSGITKRKSAQHDGNSFACYIRRAMRRAGAATGDKNTIYRMEQQLLHVLDQFMTRYVDAVARQSQSALDITHLKHLNINALQYALGKVTPASLTPRVIANVRDMSRAFIKSRPEATTTSAAAAVVATTTEVAKTSSSSREKKSSKKSKH